MYLYMDVYFLSGQATSARAGDSARDVCLVRRGYQRERGYDEVDDSVLSGAARATHLHRARLHAAIHRRGEYSTEHK